MIYQEVIVVRKLCFGLVPMVALLLACQQVEAKQCGGCESAACGGCESADPCGGCGDAGACGTRTVYQRQYVTEMRPVTCTEYTTETRERTYTVMKRVPKTEEKTKTVTVCVPETKTKTVNTRS